MSEEHKGLIITGAHLVHCHYDTRFNKQGNLCRVPSPLLAGLGGESHWTKHETRPGGWHRDVEMCLETDATDPTRVLSPFEVVKVQRVEVSTGRDPGYGGGIEVTVRRLDGKMERIRYTRNCCFNTDVTEPFVVYQEPT